jgi:hypothetical protein
LNWNGLLFVLSLTVDMAKKSHLIVLIETKRKKESKRSLANGLLQLHGTFIGL